MDINSEICSWSMHYGISNVAKEWQSASEIVQACLDLGVMGQVCEIARNRRRASAGRVLAERCCMKSTWFTNESKTISAELPSAVARGAVVHKC